VELTKIQNIKQAGGIDRKGNKRSIIDRDNEASFSLIIKLFNQFSPNLSNSAHDSPDQTHDRIKI
jgi:hypothetical protein